MRAKLSQSVWNMFKSVLETLRGERVCCYLNWHYCYCYYYYYYYLRCYLLIVYLILLAAFAQLLKVTISFLMSLRLSASVENSAPTGWILVTFYI
jgi:hypothetical protein